jgi:ABC-type uncharacterized transport system involved in gliding motility auxiliary subunit
VTRALNVLAWIGTGLVFVAAAVRILGWADAMTVSPDMDRYAMFASWAGLALVLLYTLGQWRQIVAWFGHRNARYGTLASVSVLVGLGILVAANYLANRENKRWDLTENRQFTLSDQTVKLLQGLTAPVKFVVFDRNTNFDRFRTRLTNYEYNSRQVSTEYIDPDQRPVQAKEYEIQQYGTVVVEYMGRRERVTTDAEQDITNALIKVLNPSKKKVYFLGGHGEKDTTVSERTGYSGIADALKRDNYEFDKLVLAQTNEIPADATVLVEAGPRTDLLEQEVPLLRDYLNKSGKLLVLLDPAEDLKQFPPMPRLEALMAEWGLQATKSVVVDVSGRTSVATVPVSAPPYPTHPITERFDLITMFPLVRAIAPTAEIPEGRTPLPFLQTAQRSWSETTMAQLDQENVDKLAPETDKGDTTGPVTIGMAVAVPNKTPEPPKPAEGSAPEPPPPAAMETRVAAIGDSDFASNAYLGVEGNRDLFMNTLSWLAQQENLISIRPREAGDRRLTLTAAQTTLMFWLSIVVIPGAVLGTGVYTWWRRRSS